MSVQISRLTPKLALEVVESLAVVYAQTFSQPPYNESPKVFSQFRLSLQHHVELEGFDCVIARNRDNNKLIGFAYGYTSLPGQWWHDSVTDGLSPTLIENWFSDCFELVDLAVLPEAQGRGIGSSILETITSALPHRTAALSTLRAETTAFHLYQKRGWLVLNPTLNFPNIKRPYILMGKELG